MLFKLRDVFMSEGASQKLSYALDLSSVMLNDIRPFIKPVEVSAFAENKAGLVRLKLDVLYTYLALCDRCGVDVERIYRQCFEHILVVSLSGDSDDEYIETPDYNLELDDLVTADILLELPSKFLCKESCKGLCSQCGKNLNEGECSCCKDRTDPRLEALKQLID